MAEQKDTTAAVKPLLENATDYKHRLLLSVFPAALLVFIYFFFGPLDLITANGIDILFDMLAALPYYLCAFLVLTAVITALISLLRGKAFDRAVITVFVLAVASYIQGTFLNPYLGLLDGKTIDWSKYRTDALINIFIWILMAAVLTTACRFLKKHRYKLISGLSILLILMQTVALVGDISTTVTRREENVSFRFAADKQLTVSENENVLVFIFDAFSNSALNEMLKLYPDTLDFMNDFTHYSNCAPEYYATFPEVIHMFTGYTYDNSLSYADNQAIAWQTDNAQSFFTLLKDNNYYRQFLTTESVITENSNDIKGLIDNVAKVKYEAVPDKMFEQLFYLTAYRYFPTACKPEYWSTPGEYSQISELIGQKSGRAHTEFTVQEELSGDSWESYGCPFYDALCEEGLTTVSEQNMFTLYHFAGAHTPYLVDENLDLVEGVSRAQQCRGYFAMLEEYINNLKELGLYDSSTIIVTADHGDQIYDGPAGSQAAILFMKEKGEKHSAMNVDDTALSHKSFLPTLAAAVDESSSSRYGVTFREADESTYPVRTLRMIEFATFKKACFFVFNYSCHIDELTDMTKPDAIERLDKDTFW